MKLRRDRYIEKNVLKDIQDKLVFIGGPRQVGKTTFAFHLLGARKGKDHPGYLNWDIDLHRQKIIQRKISSIAPFMVFDEIHKYVRWRNFMKGFFDLYYPKRQALVTGSARLDYYRKGGDSLQGRYHYYRLHPYSLNELSKHPGRDELDALLQFGGFPEPLFKADATEWRRWQRERISRILRVDLRDLERVSEISHLEVLMEALPARVGSPLSLQSLREDLGVSHDSIRRWIQIFENLYICFRISPFGGPKIRAVKKEQKLYFWDWSQVESPGGKFENMVASQLLKFCHLKEDTEGYNMELRYVRDIDKREVDFVVLQDKKPLFAVECKTGDEKTSQTALYFKERTLIPKFFQVHLGKKDYGYEDKGVRVLPFLTFIKELQMP
ncbi:MAG: ATP-binding protein [Deltaproteobacteria bacterium]|nr:ATP-binding protein [Deltaproteobacteria bacterium]